MAEYLIDNLYDAGLNGIIAKPCAHTDSRLSVNGTEYAPQIDFDPNNLSLPCNGVLWGMTPARKDSLQPGIPPKGCANQRAVGLCPLNDPLTIAETKAIQNFVESMKNPK